MTALPTLDYVCPADHAPLVREGSGMRCTTCDVAYPVVRGVPILIHDANSVFSRADYVESGGYAGASGYCGPADRSSGVRRKYREFARLLSQAPVPGAEGVDDLKSLLLADFGKRVLVVGAGDGERLPNVVRTDVALADGIDCVCDAHDLPFQDGTFDVVSWSRCWSTCATRSGASARSPACSCPRAWCSR